MSERKESGGNMNAFSGLYVATLTPFSEDNRVNAGVIREHVGFLIHNGVAGLCPVGTTGEFLYLSKEEKLRVIRETVRSAQGRVRVIAGIWSLNMAETARLAREAEQAGADAVFLPPPIYYPADEETIFRYYQAVRQVTQLPVFAYNIPAYASNTISLACAERMVQEGVIQGIKDSTGDAGTMTALVERLGERISVMAASDAFVSAARKIGAHGFISALANYDPALVRRIWDGETDLQETLTLLRSEVKSCGGLPAIKYLTGLTGFAMGSSRLPFSALTDEQKQRLRQTHERISAGRH
jgi:dihydrodipicolinate synthase/N-acetylneuraminate lyase